MTYQENPLEDLQVFCLPNSKDSEDSFFQSSVNVEDVKAVHDSPNVSDLLISSSSSDKMLVNDVTVNEAVLNAPDNFDITSKSNINTSEAEFLTIDIDYSMVTSDVKEHIDESIRQIVGANPLQHSCLLRWNAATNGFVLIPLEAWRESDILDEEVQAPIPASVDFEKSRSKTHQCHVCEACFDEMPPLVTHYHLAHKLFKCPQCTKYFTQNFLLKAHSLVHTDKCEFACTHCQKQFKRKKDLQQHVKRFHLIGAQTPVMFLCDTCGYQTRNKRSIRSHVLGHMNVALYRCDICDKRCKSKLDLADHRNTHFDLKPYQCDICSMGFARKQSMVIHRRTQHECSNPYICDLCGRNFLYKTSLNVHMQLHKGANRVECDVCGKIMSGKIALLNHKKIHTQQRDFVCGICGKMYINKYSLQEHLLVHTGSKPFQCLQCDNSFSSRKKLLMHERIHDPLRVQYRCSFCEKSYLTKFKLKDHVIKHHPTTDGGLIQARTS